MVDETKLVTKLDLCPRIAIQSTHELGTGTTGTRGRLLVGWVSAPHPGDPLRVCLHGTCPPGWTLYPCVDRAAPGVVPSHLPYTPAVPGSRLMPDRPRSFPEGCI